MDIDLKHANNIEIVVASRWHKAEFLEEGAEGEFLFKIIERDHPYLLAHSGDIGSVTFTIDDKKFFFRGVLSSPTIDTAIMFKPTPIASDGRHESRQKTAIIKVKIKAKAFMRTSIIEANLSNISRTGAQFATSVLLDTTRQYEFEATLPIHHAPKSFSTVFTVRYCIGKKGAYISGIQFEEFSMPLEHKKALDEFLVELQKW